VKILWAVVAAIVALVVVGEVVKLMTPSTYDQCVSGLVTQGDNYIQTGNDTLPLICLKLTPAQRNQAIRQAVKKVEQQYEGNG
jgi:hypothetical protein